MNVFTWEGFKCNDYCPLQSSYSSDCEMIEVFRCSINKSISFDKHVGKYSKILKVQALVFRFMMI